MMNQSLINCYEKYNHYLSEEAYEQLIKKYNDYIISQSIDDSINWILSIWTSDANVPLSFDIKTAEHKKAALEFIHKYADLDMSPQSLFRDSKWNYKSNLIYLSDNQYYDNQVNDMFDDLCLIESALLVILDEFANIEEIDIAIPDSEVS